MRHIGFTGTRKVIENRNIEFLLRGLLKEYREEGQCTLHHGDCIGMDEMAHWFASELDYYIVVHPPANPKYRAYCEKFKITKQNKIIILSEKDYLVRNKRIVNASEFMIAAPIDPQKEILRSGTWAAVRYARKQNKEVVFI